jgi:hypothetical protein
MVLRSTPTWAANASWLNPAVNRAATKALRLLGFGADPIGHGASPAYPAFGCFEAGYARFILVPRFVSRLDLDTSRVWIRRSRWGRGWFGKGLCWLSVWLIRSMSATSLVAALLEWNVPAAGLSSSRTSR